MRSVPCVQPGPAAIVLAALAWLRLCGPAWTDEPSPAAEVAVSTESAAVAVDAKVSTGPATVPVAKPAPPSEPRLRFQFSYQPWREVLDWFARKADLSLVADIAPPGTFNYSDDHEYTPAQAIDLLNGVLLTKGYILVRQGRKLMLYNVDEIPDNAIPTVPIEDLSKKGEFELVKVLFNLEQLKPEEAQAEIQKLLGPQGSVVPLIKSRQVWVRDTAGRLRMVQQVLERIEGPSGSPTGGAPDLVVYPIAGMDSQWVLTAVQMGLTGQADARLAVDAKTSTLFAYARPAQHAKIAETINRLKREGQRIEVIRLMRVDPQMAVLSINRLFGLGDSGKGSAAGPQVDADLSTRQLMIRGTDLEIAQIRDMLQKLGENLTPGGVTNGGRMRTLPMNASAVNSALGRIQEIWPTLRANELRIVVPPPVLSNTPPAGARRPDEPLESLDRPQGSKPAAEPVDALPAPAEKPAAANEPAFQAPSKPAAEDDHSAGLSCGARVICVAEQSDAQASPPAKAAAPIVVVPGPNGLTITSEDAEALDEFERLLNAMADGTTAGRQITVFYLKHAQAASVLQMIEQIIGSGTGVAGRPSTDNLASEPPSASTMDSGGAAARPGAARRDRAMMGNGAAAAETPSAGASPASAPASVSAGIGRSVLATGPIKITSDKRLNALFVQANRADLNTIDRLLKVLDLPESPEEIALAPKPRMIPVRHTRASEIAEILKQVYVDRMVENPNANQQMMPGGPMAGGFLRGMGMRGQQQPGGSQRGRDDTVRLSIGVDSRSNAVVVAAPDSLFEEVRQLVGELDQAATTHDQTVRVVAMHGTSLEAVGRAIEALGGNAVQINGAFRGAAPAGTPPNAPPPAWQPGPNPQEQGNPPQSFPQQRGLPGGRRARAQPAAAQP